MDSYLIVSNRIRHSLPRPVTVHSERGRVVDFLTARVTEYRAIARFITGVLGSVAYKDENSINHSQHDAAATICKTNAVLQMKRGQTQNIKKTRQINAQKQKKKIAKEKMSLASVTHTGWLPRGRYTDKHDLV